MQPDRWTVVITGGGAIPSAAVGAVRTLGASAVVAADSGLDHAVAAGIEPTHLVGDLDSLSASGRMWAYAHGLAIDEHPADKDCTDTELALEVAAAIGTGGLLVVGGIGERIDHLLGILLALGGTAAAHFDAVRAVIGSTEFAVIHEGRRAVLDLAAGTTFSVLALHGACGHVELRGAKWSLDGPLSPTEARGVSNIAEGAVTVASHSGIVTVAVPS
ncbi:MAG: putative thiamine pyrophosphokinae [Actinomycetota bacterium]|jgi:thiamine pyrophosphokinase